MTPFPTNLTISTKLRILSVSFAVFLGASAYFSSRAMVQLSRDASIREQVGLQMASLYELNLLLTREIEGQPVRGTLTQSITDVRAREETLVTSLRNAGLGTAAAPRTNECERYLQGLDVALGLSDDKKAGFARVTEALTPLAMGFSSLERSLAFIDDDEFEYHLESSAEVRQFLSALRGPLYKLVALPDGEELAQTELAIQVLTDRTLTTTTALYAGSEELELEPLKEYESVAEPAQALLKDVEQFSSDVIALVKDKVSLAKHCTALGDTLDQCVSALSDISLQAAASSKAYEAQASRLMIVLAAASLVLTALLFLFGRYLSRSLVSANDIASEIAGGNLDQTIDGGREDEIGALFAQLAHMQANLRSSRDEVEDQLEANEAKSRDLEKLHEAQLQQASSLEVALLESERLAKADAKRAAEDMADAHKLETKVSELLAVVERAADGDLTVEASTGDGNEIDRVAKGVNRLLDCMRVSIHAIANSAGDITVSSEGMLEISTRMNENASSTHEKATNVATEAETLRASAATISASTGAMNESTQAVTQELIRSTEVVGRATVLAGESESAMGSLSESVGAIGSISEGIKAIAMQTNLLALNATIEAARAGDAGKGFAVVANEVKGLSKSTAEATDSIEKLLVDLERCAAEAISAISEITVGIGEIHQVTQSFSESIETQVSSAREIDDAATLISKIGQDLGENAQTLTASAEFTKSGADSTQVSSSGLSEMATSLRGLVGRFRYEA